MRVCCCCTQEGKVQVVAGTGPDAQKVAYLKTVKPGGHPGDQVLRGCRGCFWQLATPFNFKPLLYGFTSITAYMTLHSLLVTFQASGNLNFLHLLSFNYMRLQKVSKSRCFLNLFLKPHLGFLKPWPGLIEDLVTSLNECMYICVQNYTSAMSHMSANYWCMTFTCILK